MKRTRSYYHRDAKNEYKKPKLSHFQYPETFRDESIYSDKFGVRIYDPYSWLEVSNNKTNEWIDEQNKLAYSYINSYPYLDKIKNKMNIICKYEKQSMPLHKNGKYYYYKHKGEKHAILYEKDSLYSKKGRIFFDPNKLSSDGSISLSQYKFSPDGKYWAYALNTNGSDWETIFIKSLEENKDINDELKWVKFSGIEWSKDSKGFFYCKYENAKENDTEYKNHTIYYHYLNTCQQDDIIIYKDKINPYNCLDITVSDCGKYIIVNSLNGCKEEHVVLYANIEMKLVGLKFNYLINNENNKWNYIMNNNNLFYFMTNYNAPNNKVVCIDIYTPNEKYWKTVVEEMNCLLEHIEYVNDQCWVLTYMKDVKNILHVFDLKSNKVAKEITLSMPSSISVLGSTDDSFFFSCTSFLSPNTIYRYSLLDDKSEIYYKTNIPSFDPSLYNVKQVYYKSKDSTMIPMYIVNKKNNNNNACYLYGYGGFNCSVTPYFSIMDILLLDNFNMTFAIANIRGGGEYGKYWHEDGMLDKKQNCFDDFHYAAKYLIDNHYTCSEKLVINGASNGGLLVAASVNQHPETYGCAIADVGVMDMLKFHEFTAGIYWQVEYGDSSIENDFHNLFKYSPLHNINKQTPYPPVLLTTSDHDDRVVPLHSYKYIASLQHEWGNKRKQKNPLILKTKKSTGHGHGKSLDKIINETAEQYAFIASSIGLKWHDNN